MTVQQETSNFHVPVATWSSLGNFRWFLVNKHMSHLQKLAEKLSLKWTAKLSPLKVLSWGWAEASHSPCFLSGVKLSVCVCVVRWEVGESGGVGGCGDVRPLRVSHQVCPECGRHCLGSRYQRLLWHQARVTCIVAKFRNVTKERTKR